MIVFSITYYTKTSKYDEWPPGTYPGRPLRHGERPRSAGCRLDPVVDREQRFGAAAANGVVTGVAVRQRQNRPDDGVREALDDPALGHGRGDGESDRVGRNDAGFHDCQTGLLLQLNFQCHHLP